MGLFSENTRSNIPPRKIMKDVDVSTPKTESTTNKTPTNMLEAILAALGPVVSGVTGVFTSKNNLKAKQAEADKIVKEIDLETAKGKTEALKAALEVKKEEIARLETQDKANANIRAVLYVGGFALLGFFGWLLFGRTPKTTIQTPKSA